MSDVQKEIALKVTTDTTQTQKAFANAQQELEETRKALVDLALAGKQGTAEFQQMEKRAGQLQDAIADVNRRVNNLANDTPKLQILGEAATAIAGGFALAQGAAALFGEENEEVQQAILKTQGAMTLLNGVQQVANSLNKDSALMMAINANAQRLLQLEVVKSTLALRGWSLALAATGVGAVVVVLGLLAAAFQKSREESDALTKSLEEQKEQQELLKKEIELTIKARELELAFMKTLGANEKQIALERLKIISDQMAAQQEAIDTEKRNIELLEGFANTAATERRKLILKEKEFAINQLGLQLLEQLNIIRDYDAKVAQSTTERVGNVEQIESRGAMSVQANTQASLDAQIQANSTAFLNNLDVQKRIAETNAFYNAQKKQDAENYQIAVVGLTRGGFQAIADLTTFFAGQSQEAQERAFKVQKAANIATTLIDTYASAVAAYRSQLSIPTPDAPIRAAVAAGIAVAAGLARVAAIRNTSFGSASTSAAPQAVRPAGIPQASPPPAAFNPNTSTPVLPPQGQGGQQNGPNRVIVVESDIRRVSNRVGAAERFATL